MILYSSEPIIYNYIIYDIDAITSITYIDNIGIIITILYDNLILLMFIDNNYIII